MQMDRSHWLLFKLTSFFLSNLFSVMLICAKNSVNVGNTIAIKTSSIKTATKKLLKVNN